MRIGVFAPYRPDPRVLGGRGLMIRVFAPYRFVRTVRAECTDRTLILSRRHLERVVGRYIRHYNDERPHRGIQLETPTPNPRPIVEPSLRRIRRRDVLGGLIHEYRADAA